MYKNVNVEKIITCTKKVDLQIDGITLLSVDEYKKVRDYIKPTYSIWWLRSPDDDAFHAAYVKSDSYVSYTGSTVGFGYGVRPALRINLESSDLQIGDSFQFGEYTWTVITKDYALCDTTICKMPFRKHCQAQDANDYEKSDIKKFLDEWYAAQTEPSSETSADDLVSRTKILNYIDRVKNSGLGKHKSLEYIEKYVEKMDPGDETSKDTISRQAAIEAIEKAYCNPCKERGDDHNEVRCRACNFDDAIIQIDAVPPVEPETTETMIVDGEPTEIDPLSYEVGYTHGQTERPQGEWVRTKNPIGETIVVCSNCGKIRQQGYDNFCGFCGADMKGDKE